MFNPTPVLCCPVSDCLKGVWERNRIRIRIKIRIRVRDRKRNRIRI